MMGAALDLVRDMEAALGRAETEMGSWFHEEFVWDGNRGGGLKQGLTEFRDKWRIPFRAAFSDPSFMTRQWLEDGNWVARFGTCHAVHSGTFMGIAPSMKDFRIPYSDFLEIRRNRIACNQVSADFPEVLAQLSVDVFGGEGWETLDPGGSAPPVPAM